MAALLHEDETRCRRPQTPSHCHRPVTIVTMERVVEEEWLDEDRGTPEEIRAALHSITLVNQRFGGVRLHARLLRQALARASREHRPHILEVASGRADVLHAELLRIRGSAEAMPDLVTQTAP